eukprot:578451-Alexandrium_andersonii.AAC.1
MLPASDFGCPGDNCPCFRTKGARAPCEKTAPCAHNAGLRVPGHCRQLPGHVQMFRRCTRA